VRSSTLPTRHRSIAPFTFPAPRAIDLILALAPTTHRDGLLAFKLASIPTTTATAHPHPRTTGTLFLRNLTFSLFE
jgi:hypothetical protein